MMRVPINLSSAKVLSFVKATMLRSVATGLEVYESMQAAEMLAADGINAKVINIHTIKPLDEELVVASAKEMQKSGYR